LILLVFLLGQTAPAFAGTFNPDVWAGNWYGMWFNTSFGSAGPMDLRVSYDPTTKTMFYLMDLAGSVGGASNPPPVGGSGTYTTSGFTHDFSDDGGSGSVTFTADTITINVHTVASSFIKSVTINGTVKDGLVNFTYEVEFTTGDPAMGVSKMMRRPTPPLNLGDINGNGTHEFAALKLGFDGNQKVFVKDSKSKERVSVLNFGKIFHIISMVMVPDSNANNAPEIAALGVNNTTGNVRVLIMDSKTGKNIRSIFYNKANVPIDLVMKPGTGLAVLGMNAMGKVQVTLKSHLTGKLLRIFHFGSGVHATNLALLPGSPSKFVVAGFRLSDTKVVAIVRNSITGNFVKSLVYGSDQIPFQILIENNTRVSILICGITGNNTSLVRRDAVTGAIVPTIFYGTTKTPRQVMMVGNIGGGNANDIALLSIVRASGTVRVGFRDAGSRKPFQAIFYGKAYKPGAMVKLRSTGGGPAQDLAVQGINTMNASRLELRDLKSRLFVSTIPIR